MNYTLSWVRSGRTECCIFDHCPTETEMREHLQTGDCRIMLNRGVTPLTFHPHGEEAAYGGTFWREHPSIVRTEAQI